MTTDMKSFFTAVASRMWKENDLSDMTFALCQSNMAFKQFFLDFFFGKNTIRAEDANMTREYATDGSRPDFWIETPSLLYIVEVKIWDGNQHFQQYLPFVQGDKKRLGYIAAYKIIADEKGNAVNNGSYPGLKTWAEFIQELSSVVHEDGIGVGDPAIVGYMQFVRRVCGIGNKQDEYEDLDTIDAGFLTKLDEVVSRSANAVNYCHRSNVLGCTIYSRAPSCSDYTYRKGVHFEFKYKEKQSYGFVGVYFRRGRENPQFVICFENRPGWALDICKSFAPYVKNSGLWFYPSEEEIMGNDNSLGKCLMGIITGLNNGNIAALPQKVLTISAFETMKKVQLFDRQLQMGKLNFSGDAKGVEYSVRYHSNSWKWNGAVGEYFEILIPSKEIVALGWMGLSYHDGVSGVLRFVSGPFRNKGDIVLWNGEGELKFVKFLELFRMKLEEQLSEIAGA